MINIEILTDIIHDHKLCDTQKKELEKVIDYIRSEPKNKAIEEFFNLLWNLYPIKRGKGAVSTAKKKVLYKIGIEEMTRAINRYTTEMRTKDQKYWKHGSTFFNSGYVDYLDANYKYEEPTEDLQGLRRVVIK